jgi:hypothetical protein
LTAVLAFLVTISCLPFERSIALPTVGAGKQAVGAAREQYQGKQSNQQDPCPPKPVFYETDASAQQIPNQDGHRDP